MVSVTVSNESAEDILIPDTVFCLETAGSNGTCDLVPGGTDWGVNWFGATPVGRKGKFTLGGHESRTFYGDLMAFHDKRLMMPGQYALRVRHVFLDIRSNTFLYTVDEPRGENRAFWLTMVQTPPADTTFLVPYFTDYRLEPALAAHASSDYTKIAAYYALSWKPTPDIVTQLRRVQAYATPGLPEAFDTRLHLDIATAYQMLAMELARRGSLDQGVQQAKQGMAVLDQLAQGSEYARAAAKAVVSDGPWTRSELEHYAAILNGTAHARVVPVKPLATCVVLNTNATFTAWFGYQNDNNGILQVPRGSRNSFSPAPADRGQPINFTFGRHAKLFSVTAPVGTSLRWTLDGKTAEAQTDSDRCGSNDDQEKGQH
jgi:hypothetical protein